MDNKIIGKYLQEKRKSKEMTQSDLAQILNVTYQAVSRWETGESLPDITTLDQLATLYNVSIDEILQRETTTKKGNDDFEVPEPIQSIFLMVIVFLHAIGFGLFFTFTEFHLKSVGILLYFILIVSGLFIQNLGIFVNKNRTKKDIVIYLVTYLPLVVSIMLIALYD